MPLEIIEVLTILAIAIVLLITEWVRIEVVALMVLTSLVVAGLVTPIGALSGFSNPAVVTVWAVLILSGGLARMGVSGLVGRRLFHLADVSEICHLGIFMQTDGILSSFLNDNGVTSFFLLVVIDIACQTKQMPSKLLMPRAFFALLGGPNTMIDTPPKILISEALKESGMRAFRLFDYTPVGINVLMTETTIKFLVGSRLLPNRERVGKSSSACIIDFKILNELGDHMIAGRNNLGW